MNKMTFKDVLKKCFGKEKDDRWHAVAMLALYGIFFLISFIIVSSWDVPEKKEEKWEKPVKYINYSYTYTINYGDSVDVYFGKRYGEKEKFTLVKDGVNTEYVSVNNAVYSNVNDTYQLVDSLGYYYKYLDRIKLLSLIDYNLCTNDNSTYTCNIDSKNIAQLFGDTIIVTDDVLNTVIIVKENDDVKNIKLDLSNYISNVVGEPTVLTINMNYTDIGTIKDFRSEINIEK